MIPGGADADANDGLGVDARLFPSIRPEAPILQSPIRRWHNVHCNKGDEDEDELSLSLAFEPKTERAGLSALLGVDIDSLELTRERDGTDGVGLGGGMYPGEEGCDPLASGSGDEEPSAFLVPFPFLGVLKREA